MSAPALYVVATPIGNLSDLSPRAAETLRKVDWVAAEDTRHSAALLQACASSARMLAAHEHNEEAAANQVIAYLQAGQSVALISDAGTPAISDPGARLVARVRAAGFPVFTLPGPCAAIAALSISGFYTGTAPGRFLFVGFLPGKTGQRSNELAQLANRPETLVFYEAPHRIVDTVAALAKTFDPERPLLIARELSKLFEQSHVCPLGEALAWLEADANRQKGEFVLVLAPAPAQDQADDTLDPEHIHILSALLAEGLPVKQAARIAATITGTGKNALYRQALTLRGAADDEI